MKQFSGDKLLIAIMSLCLIAPSLVWACIRNEIFAWDQAAYADNSIELWYTLAHHARLWPDRMFSVVWGQRPPAIAWIGQFFVPLGQFIHSIDCALLLSIVVTQFCTILLLISIGRELNKSHRVIWLLPAVIVASTNMFVAASAEYLVEPIQLLSTVFMYWVALKSRRFSFWQTVGFLLLASSFGVLTKASTPLYCFAPGFYALFNAWQALRQEKAFSPQALVKHIKLLSVSILAMLAATYWYVRNLAGCFEHVQESAWSDIAVQFYGRKLPILQKLAYWLHITNDRFFLLGFDWCCLALVLLVLALCVINHRYSNLTAVISGNRGIILACLVQVVAILFVHASNVNEETRYILSLFPALAILLTLIVSCYDKAAISYAFICLFLVQFVATHALLFTGKAPWTLTPYPFDSLRSEELARAAKLVSNMAPYPQYGINICGVNYIWLSAASLNYYANKERLSSRQRTYFDDWSYKRVKRLDDFRKVSDGPSFCFVSLEKAKQETPPDSYNVCDLAVLKNVQADKRFVRVPFASKIGIVIYKRTP